VTQIPWPIAARSRVTYMPHEINHVWTHIISLACAHPPDTALQRQQGEQPPLAPPPPIYLPVPSTHFQRGAAVEEGRGGSGGRGRGQSISGNEYDNSGAGVRIGATWPRAASETAHCTSLSHPWQYSSTCHCVTSGRASPQISWAGKLTVFNRREMSRAMRSVDDPSSAFSTKLQHASAAITRRFSRTCTCVVLTCAHNPHVLLQCRQGRRQRSLPH
jgi:hypothetical protein